MKFRLQTHLDSYEKESVLKLLVAGFATDSPDKSYKTFNFILNNIPAINFLLVKDQSNKILGLSCLLDREFNYFGITMKLTAMSFMAVHPEFRNFSVTNILKQGIFEYLAKNSDLSMGIARKKMDGYWYPYGYLGFTNFGQLSIGPTLLPRQKSDLCVKRMTAKYISIIKELFNLTYGEVLGPLKRDTSLWAYYLKKADREQLIFNIFCKGSRIVGYLIRKDNIIHEFGLEDASALDLLSFLRFELEKERLSDKQIHFQIGFSHPSMHYLRSLPHILTARYVWNGGHIIRITSLTDFLFKIRPVLEKRLKNTCIKDFSVNLSGYDFIFMKGKLKILQNKGKKDKDVLNFSFYDWQKIIFGIVPADEISNIRNSKFKEIFNVMFPVVFPQVPFIDQF